MSNNTTQTMNYMAAIKQIVTSEQIIQNANLTRAIFGDDNQIYFSLLNILGNIWTEVMAINNIILG